ncbi:MAG: serine/threonine protein kinase [Oligoflexia bacterium]|nr:serine/threonine protein kinase [Oligoflexia bacterium]
MISRFKEEVRWRKLLVSTEHEFREGELFAGRYRLVRRLGRGGMGAVYLVEDSMLGGEQVALKLLHADLCRNEKHTQRFLREVRLTRKVTHPGVVRTFDVGNQDGRLFFTMEFAEGRTLKERLLEGPIDPMQVARILREICKGLYAIHGAEIVHRDLKPGNVIMTPDGFMKITDFGIAKPGSSDLTSHNEVIGSIPYMAPEVWVGRDVGTQADIYALGIMAYEMLVGFVPFEGDAPAELMCKHLETKPIPPRELSSLVPEWLNDLVLCMLEKDQALRPQGAEAVVKIINFHLDGQGELPPAPVKSKPQRAGYEVHNSDTGPNLLGADLLAAPAPTLDEVMSDEGRIKLGVVRQRNLLRHDTVTLDEIGSVEAESAVSPVGQAVRTVVLLLFAVAVLVLGFYQLGPYVARKWTETAEDGSFISVASVLLGVGFAYSLFLMLPMLVLCSFRRSTSAALRGWIKSALVFLGIASVIYGVNLFRVEARSYELNLAYDRGRFFSTAEATLSNMVEAAMLLPAGTAYRPAIKFRYPVLIETRTPTLPERLPYYTLLMSYVLCFVRLSERWLFRQRRRRLAYTLVGFACIGLIPLGVELLVSVWFSSYLELYSLKNYSLSFGPLLHRFDEVSLTFSMVNWLIAVATLTFVMPLVIKRSQRVEENAADFKGH